MRILVSGGHLTPALAFIEYTKSVQPESFIFFAGRKYSRKDEKQLANEQQESEKLGAIFIPFNSGKLGQGGAVEKTLNFLALIGGVIRALVLIPRYRPSVFVSFGGYLAVPLAIAAWLWRVPVVTHEQTRTVGIANGIIAKFANKIAVAYPETTKHFPANKTSVVGNPIRQALLNSKAAKQPEWFKTTSKRPLLYVTGGSQGSEVINTTVARSLPQILKDWSVIHQCGQATEKRNYAEELEKASAKLNRTKRGRYFVRPWITDEELSWIYANATATISRAGANTVSEITHMRLPAILIPIPFSHKDEQILNAKALSDLGGAILLPQKDLNPKSLTANLEIILSKHASFSRKLEKANDSHAKAAAKLFQLVKPYL